MDRLPVATRASSARNALKNHHAQTVTLPLVMLVLALFLGLLLLTTSIGILPTLAETLAVQHQAHTLLTDPPTSTPTTAPTATVPANPPTIKLVSPSSGYGPVGAHITVQGTHFTGTSARLFGSTAASCSAPTGTLTTASVSGGNMNTTFVWPVAYAPGVYYICAVGMSDSSAAYHVLTASQPTLSLSSASIQVGQQLTIQGNDFAGAAADTPVLLMVQSETLQLNAVLDGNGTFTVNWTVDNTFTGPVTIRASAEAEGSAPPVLQASASATILAASVTPTAQVSPSAAVTDTPNGSGIIVTPNQNSTSSPVGLIIFAVTAIILLLLIVLAVVIVITMRSRNRGAPEQPAPAGYNPNNPYGGTGRYAAMDMFPQQQQTGRFGATQQFGNSQIGGVSQWDDTDSQPGPDWQPRPMSGYGTEYQSGYGTTTTQGYGTNAGQGSMGAGQQGYPPLDPWDSPAGSYGGYPEDMNQWYGGSQGRSPNDPRNQGKSNYGNYGAGEDLYGGSPASGPGATRQANPPYSTGQMNRSAGQPGQVGQPGQSRTAGMPGMPPGNSAGSTAPAWGNGNESPYPAMDDWPDLGGSTGPTGSRGNPQR